MVALAFATGPEILSSQPRITTISNKSILSRKKEGLHAPRTTCKLRVSRSSITRQKQPTTAGGTRGGQLPALEFHASRWLRFSIHVPGGAGNLHHLVPTWGHSPTQHPHEESYSQVTHRLNLHRARRQEHVSAVHPPGFHSAVHFDHRPPLLRPMMPRPTAHPLTWASLHTRFLAPRLIYILTFPCVPALFPTQALAHAGIPSRALSHSTKET